MKVDIEIPESLNEVTLDQYQRYLKIQENNDDEKFLAVKMIEIFCGIRGDHVLLMRATDINSIVQILTEMLNDKPKLVHNFKMKGTQYGFIPKLDDMSFGEYIDLDTFIGDWENMHRAMNVLYRPVVNQYGDKYNIQDYDVDIAERLKDMPMSAVLGSIVFFYNLGMDLSKAMLNYLTEEEMGLAQHLISDENGGGINHFTHSLREILDDLKISLN
jgi:hypothetical protein